MLLEINTSPVTIDLEFIEFSKDTMLRKQFDERRGGVQVDYRQDALGWVLDVHSHINQKRGGMGEKINREESKTGC